MHSLQTALVTAVLMSIILSFVILMPNQYTLDSAAAARQVKHCICMNQSDAVYSVHGIGPDMWPECKPGRLLKIIQQLTDVVGWRQAHAIQ
ncbi:MAG TPA: hypothetical protein GX717_05950 [Clostridiaceae bacterium]|nr:hypothetical protein [Clostridiaceae bacterium]